MEKTSRLLVRRRIDGVLLLDKPVGLSSTQAMAAAKRLFHAEKAGHTGTLDPFATGLLPLCFGEATKFSRFLLDAHKSYRATLRLGATSSTGDTEGVIEPGGALPVTQEAIESVLRFLLGPQRQLPPMHSAVKVGGVPLYRLARRGEEVARDARDIVVDRLDLVSWRGDTLIVDCRVSKGTYIRVLAEDIGERLGCGAYLAGLRRTATGPWTLDGACSLEDLQSLSDAARDGMLLPPQALCGDLPRCVLAMDDARIFGHGGWVPAPKSAPDGVFQAVWAEGGDFLGVGSVQGEGPASRLQPARLMVRSR